MDFSRVSKEIKKIVREEGRTLTDQDYFKKKIIRAEKTQYRIVLECGHSAFTDNPNQDKVECIECKYEWLEDRIKDLEKFDEQ